MSNSIIVWGVKIYTGTAITDATIGLQAGTFQWVENELTGMAGTWKSDILAVNGISAIREGINSKYGGNVAKLMPITIQIDNTIKFYNTISANDISINGLKCEIIEFESNGGVVSETIRFRGTTRVDKWDIKNYTIPVEPSNDTRKAFMGTPVSQGTRPNSSDEDRGKMIPQTFGINNKAKFIRTAKQVSKFQSGYRVELNNNISVASWIANGVHATIFPVTDDDGLTPPIMYKITLGIDVYWFQNHVLIGAGTYDLSYFEDMYLFVIEGDGEGQYRKISSARVIVPATSEQAEIEITLSDYFKTTLATSGSTQSWVEIISIQREYEGDVWPCKNYLSSLGDVIDSTVEPIEIFSFISEKSVTVTGDAEKVEVDEKPIEYIRLPEYAYEDTASGDKNKIEIDGKMFNGDPDKMDSFLCLPPKTFYLINNASILDKYGATIIGAYNKMVAAGAFCQNYVSYSFAINNAISNAVDRDGGTFFQGTMTKINSLGTGNCLFAAELLPPLLPNGFSFDNMYLGINFVKTGSAPISDEIYIMWRRFLGGDFTVPGGTNIIQYKVFGGTPLQCIDMPDFYYTANIPGSKNIYFYPNLEDGSHLQGYENYIISSIDSVEKYNSLRRIGIFFNTRLSTIGHTTVISINEICFIFRKSISIKEAVYIPLMGRIFDDKWGNRKTATNMIVNPIDIFEHICRLQNWSEVGDTTTDFGKEYSSGALIKTDNSDGYQGGFDSRDLQPVKGRNPCFQLLDENKMWTDVFKKDICHFYYLANYINPQGQECVQFIAPDVDDMTATFSITLNDIPTGMNPGVVTEPKPEDIYCQPYINYNRSNATGEYQDRLEVLNVHKGTGNWTEDDTPGISSGIGEEIWELCVDLWNRCKQINNPPSSITDQYMCRYYQDALWSLETWIRWQKIKRIEIPVYYDKGKNYHIGQYGEINLPHQTNGATLECVIEEYEKNKNENYVNLKLILIGEIPAPLIIQDVMDDRFNNWQDVFAPYAERGEGLEDKQDIL